MTDHHAEWKAIPYAQRRDLIAQVRQRDGSLCHLCGLYVGEDEESADHIVPVSQGGRSTVDNLALAHRHCNYARGNRPTTSVRAPVSVPECDGLADFIRADEAAGRA